MMSIGKCEVRFLDQLQLAFRKISEVTLPAMAFLAAPIEARGLLVFVKRSAHLAAYA